MEEKERTRWIVSGYDGAAVAELVHGRMERLSAIDCGTKPTWAEVKGNMIYLTEGLTVEKNGRTGRINAFRLEGNVAVRVGSVDTGENPVGLDISENGKLLASANYISGTLDIFRIEDDGMLSLLETFCYEGTGRDEERQDRPYPHNCHFSEGVLYVALLGLDEVARYGVSDNEDRVRELSPIRLPGGSGPRSMADGPDGTLLVTGELDSNLYIINKKTLETMKAIPTTRSRVMNWPGSVVHSEGRIMVANRGADTIAVISPEEGLIEELPTVEFPRYMAMEKGMLFSLGQHDGMIEVRDGKTLEVLGTTEFGIPSCIAPL